MDDFDTVNEPDPDDYADPFVGDPAESFYPEDYVEYPWESEPFGDLMEWEREQVFRDEMAERDDSFADEMELGAEDRLGYDDEDFDG